MSDPLREKTPHQEALPLKIQDRGGFDTFVAGKSALIDQLKSSASSGEYEFYFVSGPKGCGKSHLLSALSRMVSGAFCVDMCLAGQFSPEFIDVRLPALTLIDNVEAIAGDEQWELALFALFNRWYDSQRGMLVIASANTFDNIPFLRADLNTRLGSGISVRLNPLEAEDCVKALMLRAKSRGFTLPESAAAFMVKHCRGNMSDLIALLDRIDNAQLQEMRGITVPFVKKVLNI